MMVKKYYNPVTGVTMTLPEWKDDFDDWGASGFDNFDDFKSEILEEV